MQTVQHVSMLQQDPACQLATCNTFIVLTKKGKANVLKLIGELLTVVHKLTSSGRHFQKYMYSVYLQCFQIVHTTLIKLHMFAPPFHPSTRVSECVSKAGFLPVSVGKWDKTTQIGIIPPKSGWFDSLGIQACRCKVKMSPRCCLALCSVWRSSVTDITVIVAHAVDD